MKQQELKHFGILGMHWGRRKTPQEEHAIKLKKSQDNWDKAAKKNWLKAYNRSAYYARHTLIPEINKKYGKYNWSSLKFNDDGTVTGDPKLVKSYKRYTEEYEKRFSETFNKSLVELIGERPKE